MRFLYVTRKEMACKCGCGQDTFDVELSEVLEDLRKHFKARLFINSGNRCIKHNAKVGGADDSYHLRSKSADVSNEKVPPSEVYAYLVEKYPYRYGIGSYDSFTHIDVRTAMKRW
jgi:uncharacterized protein YcbK (DUF882 family)